MPNICLFHYMVPDVPCIWYTSDLEVATATAHWDQYYNRALLTPFPVNLPHPFLSAIHYWFIWAAKVFMASACPNKTNLWASPVLISWKWAWNEKSDHSPKDIFIMFSCYLYNHWTGQELFSIIEIWHIQCRHIHLEWSSSFHKPGATENLKCCLQGNILK